MNSESLGKLIICGILTAFLILVGRCALHQWAISNLEKDNDRLKVENQNFKSTILGLNVQKLNKFLDADRQLDKLEERLSRNEELFKEAQAAEQKLAAARELAAQYHRIVGDLMELKRQHPELTSGD